MSNTNYYWQDGRRIPIEATAAEATVEAGDVQVVQEAARRAAVGVSDAQDLGAGLVRLRFTGNRDQAIDRLRRERVVHHVYHVQGQPDSEVLINDTFFIKFQPDVPDPEVVRFIADHHLQIVEDYDNRRLLLRVTDSTGRNAIRMANAAAERDDVIYAEPNLVRRLERFDFTPADPLFAQQWHLSAPQDGADLVRGADIDAPGAWELTLGVRDVVVCVADDGCDITHPDFQGPDKIAGQLNIVAVDSARIEVDDQVMPRAGDYHGTPCTGVAVAENNGTGVVGVAPGCALLAVRFPLSLSDSQLARMFGLISPRADVVSCSWGYGPADAPMSTTLRERIAELAVSGGRRGKGLVFCVAAGNNNCPVRDLDNTRTYRFVNRFGNLGSYSGPIDRWIAAHPDVITVAATTSLKTRSAYSSWGREISVCAPSNNFDDLRQIAVPGRGITTTDNEGAGPGSDFTAGSRFTGRFGGTSSATPTVAGVCALVLSRNPSLSAARVRQLIEETADRDLSLETDTPVNEPGDFVDGFSLWFGHGKVNAARAVAAVLPEGQERTVDRSAAGLPLAIPDNGQPVFSDLEVSEAGTVRDIRVAVDIRHTYIGDLRIDLLAPDGTGVTLHNHRGGARDDLQRVYGVADTPELAALEGRSVQGTWRLRVVDSWFFDQGEVRNWRLVAKVTL